MFPASKTCLAPMVSHIRELTALPAHTECFNTRSRDNLLYKVLLNAVKISKSLNELTLA